MRSPVTGKTAICNFKNDLPFSPDCCAFKKKTPFRTSAALIGLSGPFPEPLQCGAKGLSSGPSCVSGFPGNNMHGSLKHAVLRPWICKPTRDQVGQRVPSALAGSASLLGRSSLFAGPVSPACPLTGCLCAHYIHHVNRSSQLVSGEHPPPCRPCSTPKRGHPRSGPRLNDLDLLDLGLGAATEAVLRVWPGWARPASRARWLHLHVSAEPNSFSLPQLLPPGPSAVSLWDHLSLSVSSASILLRFSPVSTQTQDL